MTIVFRPCTACTHGIGPDGRVCWWCEGRLGESVQAPPTHALVCGHTHGSRVKLPRYHCATCAMDVEVADPTRLDEQRSRFADALEAQASELAGRALWGWPEPSLAERARLHEERVEAVIRMRRVAGAMRTRVGSKREAA